MENFLEVGLDDISGAVQILYISFFSFLVFRAYIYVCVCVCVNPIDEDLDAVLSFVSFLRSRLTCLVTARICNFFFS